MPSPSFRKPHGPMRRTADAIGLATGLVLVSAALAVAAVWLGQRYELARPQALWCLTLVPLCGIWYLIRRNKRLPAVRLSTTASLANMAPGLRVRFRHLPFLFALAGLGGLVLAMARPQSRDAWQDVTREGIDIMIAMDFSGSMFARDFKPDRLEAARNVALRFIAERPNDRIGLVVYEGEAFTQCPLTTDHKVLTELFRKAKSGMIRGGTAVGLGLATAVNRLRESSGKSKVIILLTDGVNNAGSIQPVDAARIAAEFGIRVYTVGVGSMGQALSPIDIYPNGEYRFGMVPVEIDEATLEQVATITGGRYFRATNERKLGEIYSDIDRLEKTRERVTEHSSHKEEYFPVLAVACALLCLSLFTGNTLFRTTP